MEDIVGVRHAKMSLVNMATGEELEAMFNPEEFEETLGPKWVKQSSPGASFERLHYSGSENNSYNLDLYFDAHNEERGGMPRIVEARKFLQSACVSRRATSITHAAPPTLLFVWPTFISLKCVVSGKMKFKYRRFNRAGTPTMFVVTVPLEEIRDVRLYSEDVLLSGTIRSGSEDLSPKIGED